MTFRITPLILAGITAITLAASGRCAVAQALPVVEGETIFTHAPLAASSLAAASGSSASLASRARPGK